MSNTTGALWALSVFAGSALFAFACSSDTVGPEAQELGEGTSTSAATTTGSMLNTSSGIGGTPSVSSSTGTTGTITDPTTSGAETTSPTTSGTTGSEPATTGGATTSSGAGGTSSVTSSVTSTGTPLGSAGGATGSTETSTTDTGSTAAGGTSAVVDDPECQEFCDLFFEECADEVADSFFSDQLYPDHDACMAACVTYEKGGTYGSDTLGCRRAHIADNPDGGVHCLHASESGGGQCPLEQ